MDVQDADGVGVSVRASTNNDSDGSQTRRQTNRARKRARQRSSRPAIAWRRASALATSASVLTRSTRFTTHLFRSEWGMYSITMYSLLSSVYAPNTCTMLGWGNFLRSVARETARACALR